MYCKCNKWKSKKVNKNRILNTWKSQLVRDRMVGMMKSQRQGASRYSEVWRLGELLGIKVNSVRKSLSEIVTLDQKGLDLDVESALEVAKVKKCNCLKGKVRVN